MKIIRDPSNARQVKEVVDQLCRQFDNTGTFTLATGTTTTVISNPKVSGLSKILLEPRDANAAAARATTWISEISNGQFKVTHASAATARKFDYVVFGIG